MGGNFNPQILEGKLAKLNSSQQSIETLSHWCIFHMNKARQVVETWDRQFHCSPREQRLAFLFLANDILQNSRRKGSEFVGEFWKVLPNALRDIMEHGDEFGKKQSLRLINIWDERKVFGSRGQLLKEEVAGKHMETSNRNGNRPGSKLRPAAGIVLDKIVSDYKVIYGGQLDEDVIVNKCRSAGSCIQKADKEIESAANSGNAIGSALVEELQGQHSVLRNCVEQLAALESSRATLVSHLKEALQEQELKLDQVRNELQVAKSQSEQASNLCRQLLNNNNNHLKEAQTSEPPQSSMSVSVPVMYTRSASESLPENSSDETKAAAAAVAAKLTASTSSAQMLTYVLSSLASEGVIGNSTDHPPPEKRARLDDDHPPPPPEELDANEQPRPPLSPPPVPPPLPPVQQAYPVPQFLPSAGPMNLPFGYGATPLQPPAFSGYPMLGQVQPMMSGVSSFAAPPNPYQNAEGGFYGIPMAPTSKQ